MGAVGSWFDNAVAETFLRHADQGAAAAPRSEAVDDQGRAALGDLRVRGGGLQPDPAALDAGNAFPGRV
jgi:hypothetical protein